MEKYEDGISSCIKRDCYGSMLVLNHINSQNDHPYVWIENQTGKQKWGDMNHEQYPFIVTPAQRNIYQYGYILIYSIDINSMLYLSWFFQGGTYHNVHMYIGGSSFERYGGYLYTNSYMENGMLKYDGSENQVFYSYLLILYIAIPKLYI